MQGLDPIQLELEISAGDAAENELDALARLMLPQLGEMDLESAEVARGGSGRTVKFKGNVAGQAVEFEGSAEDLQVPFRTLRPVGRK